MGEMEDRVRAYATGDRDLSKYKKCLTGAGSNWKSINWLPKKSWRKAREKVLRPFRQMIKNYSMVNRLKSLQ